MIQAIAFYLFAFLVIASAVLVIMSRNPVHSVLWLILGAVAVLFLFVVMMLDIDFAELRAGFIKNFPLGLAIAAILLAELVLGIGALSAGSLELGAATGENAPNLGQSNIANVGQLLYSKYIFVFEAAGLILLVAMIGAIVLTHRELKTTRGHQNITKQVRRNPKDATQLKQPTVGKGVEL